MAENSFKLFDITHIIIIIIDLLLIFLLILFSKFLSQTKKNVIALILAILLIINSASIYIYQILMGIWFYRYSLPLQLCDLALIAVIYTLFTKNKYTYELSYFWALSGTLLAIITPAIYSNFPDFEFITFFINHSFVVISVIYLTVAFKMKPEIKSIWRAFIITNLYLFIISVFNLIFHTNYFFVCEKPEQSSILDYFGPWPYYILACEPFALAYFFMLYLPFAFRKKLKPE